MVLFRLGHSRPVSMRGWADCVRVTSKEPMDYAKVPSTSYPHEALGLRHRELGSTLGSCKRYFHAHGRPYVAPTESSSKFGLGDRIQLTYEVLVRT